MADDNQTKNHGNDDLETRYLQLEPMDFTEEELATSSLRQRQSSSMKDTRFDMIIGHIEDIIMEDEFQTIQNDFMEKHYLQFEDTEENKFVYTDIHKQYCDLIEKHIEKELAERIEHFDMADFAAQLSERKDELEGEIFEMLMTFSDFVTFKEMFLDYRAMREETVVDLSSGLTITPLKLDLSIDACNMSFTSASNNAEQGQGDQKDNQNGGSTS